MNQKQTWWLVALAAGLFAYIYFVELRPGTKPGEAVPMMMTGFSIDRAQRVEMKIGEQLIRVERTNDSWRMTAPIIYPARQARIDGLLKVLSILKSTAVIAARDVARQPRGLADFGLQSPSLVIKMEQPGEIRVLKVGSKTTTGSQLYMQVGDANEVHVVDAALLQLFPTSADDWRDAALLPLRGLTYSRMEVRSAGRSFEVQKDVTNKVWRITKPMATRADNPKLTHLLQQLELWPVRKFVSDDPQADLEKYGLRPAEMELAFGEGTNDFVSVQFGKVSVEDPTMIYARRSSHTNIVLVPKEWMEPLRGAFSELRDRKIATLVPAAVDSIDITGAESMSIKRQTNGTWRIEGGKSFLADSLLVTNMLLQMSELEVVEFEKDVVTDFATYGLQMPSLQYTVWTNGPSGTNGSGTGLTNHMLFRLDVGRADGTKVYVRRAGEDSVYSLALGDIQQLPSKRYELRDRGIWEFATNQITKVSIGQHGLNRDIVRNPKGDWVLAPGSQGIINPFAVDEALYRLGRMRVERWVGVGADRLAAFGITDKSHRISVEVKSGEKTETYVLRISDRMSPSRRPYGAAMLDGDAVIFELPVAVFPALQSDLSIPAP